MFPPSRPAPEIELIPIHSKPDPGFVGQGLRPVLSESVAEGKGKEIGLSGVSALTLRKAHAVHPIAVVLTEYPLWTRNPEIAVLAACRENSDGGGRTLQQCNAV